MSCNGGQVWFNSRPAWYISQDIGNWWNCWGPFYQFQEPDQVQVGFSWVNQGVATISTANGGLHMNAIGSGSTDVHLRVMTTPQAAPYALYASFIPLLDASNQTSSGILLRESGTGKFVFFRLMYDTTSVVAKSDLVLSIDKYTTPTTAPVNYLTASASIIASPVVMLRIIDDGTNLYFSVGNNELYYWTAFTVSRTDFMATGPDQIGYAVSSDPGTGSAGMTLLSWYLQ
jgi:hypothetical protein